MAKIGGVKTIIVQPTGIEGVLCLEPKLFEDARGAFFESYNRQTLAGLGIETVFVQENQASSRAAATMRGLHYQKAPFAQAKLVRVIRGAIFDIAVDIRHGSPTFGHHVAVELSAQNRLQILIPEGFAHGYLTLSEETEVIYLVNRHYDKASESGILWNDPDLRIAWPLPASGPILHPRDAEWPLLKDAARDFIAQDGGK